jgi:four helix bundle protein
MENGELKRDNPLSDKSFAFAVRIVKLYKYLCDEKKEFVLSKQLLRSGTSIGANISESQDAQSSNDFISKLSISLKEARESKYWIDLLKETEYLSVLETNSILSDLEEIIKLLVSIIKTTKMNNAKK